MIGNCDVCGRHCNNLICSFGKHLCNKHYTQYKKYGKFLDSNPRTIYDRNEYHICGDITYIDLYNIKCEVVAQAIIDTEDLDKVKDIKWKLSTSGYAMNTPSRHGTNKHMSRVIYGEDKLTPDLFVDHINHNTLDNRKCNLRAVTKSQNAMNSGYVESSSKSGARGVQLRDNRYYAWIKIDQSVIKLGDYDTLEYALYARWVAEVALFGEYQYNKTPPEIPIDDACLITLYVYKIILNRIEEDINELCIFKDI